MSLLALLFALVCERGLTHVLHLREWRWLDPYFDRADSAMAGQTGLAVVLAACALIALPVLPVLLLAHFLRERVNEPDADLSPSASSRSSASTSPSTVD